MATVIRVADPAFSLSPCTIDPTACDRSPRCGVHAMWRDLDEVLWQRLESITLEQVASGTLHKSGVLTSARSALGAVGAAW